MENEKEPYDLEKLTAKNVDYIHSITRQLRAAGQSDKEINAIISEVLPKIIEAQQAGTTAKSLLGSPSHFVETCKEKKEKAAAAPSTNPYLMTLDSALLVFSLLSGLNGIMVYFGGNHQTTYGILALILSSLVGGFGMCQIYKIQQKNIELLKSGNLTRFQRYTPILLTLAYVIAWFLVTVVSLNIPSVINLKLPGLYLIVIAAIAFGLRFWLKKRYNIQSATVSRTASNRTR